VDDSWTSHQKGVNFAYTHLPDNRFGLRCAHDDERGTIGCGKGSACREDQQNGRQHGNRQPAAIPVRSVQFVSD